MDPTTGVGDDLATVLFELDTGSMSTAVVTRTITDAIAGWALGHGWSVRREARVLAAGSASSPRLGFIDVVVHRPPHEPDLAIEIDSADKPWSVDKLRHAAAAGMHAIWIRWGDDDWAGIYDDVDVIQLRLMRREAPRTKGGDQLSLWS